MIPSTLNQPAALPYPGSGQHADGSFAKTRWTVVLAAGADDSAAAGAALEQLCHEYRGPLCACLRHRGLAPPEAEDIVQAFLLRLISGDGLAAVRRERGRFRTFLLTALKHFLINDWRRRTAEKRGGQEQPLSLDGMTPEEFRRHEPAVSADQDREFDREWALTLVGRACSMLAAEIVADTGWPQEDAQEVVRAVLGDATSYRDLAAHLGISEGTFKVRVFRLRQRFREILREQVAETVDRPQETAAEIRYLMSLFSEEKHG